MRALKNEPTGYLRSHDRFDDALLIGPNEDALSPVAFASCAHLSLLGLHSDTVGDRVLFYRWDGALRLRIGSTSPLIVDDCAAERTSGPTHARFRLTRSGDTVIDYTYPLSPALLTLGHDDPTPFAEPEDFDLLLFAANVLKDKKRADRIFRPRARK